MTRCYLLWLFPLWFVVFSGCAEVTSQQSTTMTTEARAIQASAENPGATPLQPTASPTNASEGIASEGIVPGGIASEGIASEGIVLGRIAIEQEMLQQITPAIFPHTTPSPPENRPSATVALLTAIDATDSIESAPAPAPVGTVVYYEESVSLPTYPIERYQTDEIDPEYNWPYKRFDIERFRVEAPSPERRTYRLLVLENAYIKILILPELGGRIWQVIHKPTGSPIFYQNDVVKPTHWGLTTQLGWLALGGIEWSLPVIEHGYDWGTPWGYIPLQHSEDLAAVTVFTPSDGRLLTASITISLRAGTAAFEIEPTLTNLADRKISFSYWHAAMLAPGSGKHPSASLRFLLPTNKVSLHSTGDLT